MTLFQVVLSLAIALPLTLLAAGVLYYAYVLGRQPLRDGDLEAHVEALATESADALLVDLQETVERMQSQLARQHDSLSGLMSDQSRRPRGVMTPAIVPATAGPDAAPMAAGSYVERARSEPASPRSARHTASSVATPPATPDGAGLRETRARSAHPLHDAVAQLVAEGLSDRAIARHLLVGLEEVRIARVRGAR